MNQDNNKPKNMKKLTLCLTVVYFLVILAFPVYMIYDYHYILSTGEVYKIRVNAYDPYDPLRGRYVAILPDIQELRWGASNVRLVKGHNDFVTDVIRASNPDVDGYIKNFKMERYYMNEKAAPKVEERLLPRNILSSDVVYVIIKVKNGKYAIEGMYINDIPVEEYVRG
ncbi:MAG: GDYXXLXY domain-containing protein [Oscillospiraceae bacterium]|nr:GDYXXLXY domain-containing protein [Oscillospiraceae bacterium]